MEITNRQQKIFKRLITDYFKEYILITNHKIKLPSISKVNIIEFYTQVLNNLDDYSVCNENILSKISFLHEVDPKKVKIEWKTLHTLFIICIKSDGDLNKEEVIEKFEKGRSQFKTQAKGQVNGTPFGMNPEMISQMMPMISNMMGNSSETNSQLMNGGMSSLIKETSDELMKSLNGKEDQLKNINPMELFNGLMSGNQTIGGIDLSGVISNLQVSIKSKIDTGELDAKLLKENATNMMNNFPETLKTQINDLNIKDID